jgi:hypothetical protein
MSSQYPKILIQAPNGYVLVRDGLSINFYMRHSHAEVAPGLMRSLEVYLRAVGPQALGWYVDEDGYPQELEPTGWDFVRREILEGAGSRIHLLDASSSMNRYQFEYFGKDLEALAQEGEPNAVCAASFWLPSEYLEEHGPGRVRELALELAAPLPFCSGHAGLSFNCETDLLGVGSEVRQRCFRYPGMEIPAVDELSWDLGTRVRGVHWLNFLGQPVLGELGGAAGLRSRLSTPGTTVQEMEGERVVITLGPQPEAGDTERGLTLPAWRELARVLEPWLYSRKPIRSLDFPPDDQRRWERRFLD